jgi:hypothetical protein
MGPVIFVAIAAAFIGFQIWLISQQSRWTTVLAPGWVRRFRSPRVAVVAINRRQR